jgi:uncharacterized protein with HEPN domain
MTSRDQDALRDILGVMERTDYLQDALIRCIEVLGEAVKRLSPELREQTSDLPCAGWRE